MSVESTEALERSVLEGKDREQLLAIAGALGVKATSRAKKADIIAKILEQTGGPSAAESPAPARAPRASNRRRRRRNRDRNRGDGPQGADRVEAPAPQGQGGQDSFQGEPVAVAGYLDLRDEGYGFLRVNGYLPSRDDVYVSVKQTRQYGLRKGDHVTGMARPAGRNEKNPALLRIDTVNDMDPEKARERPKFEDLTPLF